MDSFTISQLQRYSGINVHSIRAWEKRYNALQPNRSDGNTRYYDGNQLRRLLNIASLMNSEYKISELCSFTDSKLFELVNRGLDADINFSGSDEFLISQMVSAALQFNEPLLNKLFSRAIVIHGLEGTYLKVLYPALQRIGVMWSAARVTTAQEHFISNLIRQKLNTSIDMLPVNSSSKNHWLLFLPENEFHECGLLMANYLVRNAGHRSTYLGSNVPFDPLKEAVMLLKPSSLLFFLVSKDDEDHDQELIRLMLQSFPAQKIFVASAENRNLSTGINNQLTLLTSVNELKNVLVNQS